MNVVCRDNAWETVLFVVVDIIKIGTVDAFTMEKMSNSEVIGKSLRLQPNTFPVCYLLRNI